MPLYPPPALSRTASLPLRVSPHNPLGVCVATRGGDMNDARERRGIVGLPIAAHQAPPSASRCVQAPPPPSLSEIPTSPCPCLATSRHRFQTSRGKTLPAFAAAVDPACHQPSRIQRSCRRGPALASAKSGVSLNSQHPRGSAHARVKESHLLLFLSGPLRKPLRRPKASACHAPRSPFRPAPNLSNV